MISFRAPSLATTNLGIATSVRPFVHPRQLCEIRLSILFQFFVCIQAVIVALSPARWIRSHLLNAVDNGSGSNMQSSANIATAPRRYFSSDSYFITVDCLNTDIHVSQSPKKDKSISWRSIRNAKHREPEHHETKRCVDRELNPGLPETHGNGEFYH